MNQTRDKYHELVWLLNDLNTDLQASVDIYDAFFKLESEGLVKSLNKNSKLSLNRNCYLQLILNLCKFNEIYKAYGKEIQSLSDSTKGSLLEISKKIDDLDILKFRNTYVGHALASVGGEKIPLSFEDGLLAFKKIITSKPESFRNWVYKKGDKKSVVWIIYYAIEECKKKSTKDCTERTYKFTPEEEAKFNSY